MREIEVDKIMVVSNPVQLDITSFTDSSRTYISMNETRLELTIASTLSEGKVYDAIEILNKGIGTLIVSNEQCVLLNKYQLEDYSEMVLTDEFNQDVDTTITITLYEEPVVAKNRNELWKEMI